MLVVLIGLGAIVLAALITLPTAKQSGIKSIILFVVLSLAGVVAAVIFAQHYHLPPSEADKAEHTQGLIVEWIESQNAEVVDAPSGKEMLEGNASLWRLDVQGQELSLLCVAGEKFPEEAQVTCSESQPLVAEEIKVDFDEIGAGH